MITELALLGLAGGLGIVLMTRAVLLARRGGLEAEVERYRFLELSAPREQLGSAARPTARPGPRVLHTLGRRLTHLGGHGGRAASRAQDLAVTGRTLDRHGVVLAWCLLAGVALPVLGCTALASLGLSSPPVLDSALGTLGGGIGVLGGGLELKRSAAAARQRFLRALTTWLELVALAQAGGMGIEGALQAASRISSDPAFTTIADALAGAQRSGASPWAGIGRLGRELGIAELDELAASLELAGSEGARIRASLSAKSAALRRRQMADAQARANSTTERLFLPSIVLMLGFMVFLMYPAAVSLAHLI